MKLFEGEHFSSIPEEEDAASATFQFSDRDNIYYGGEIVSSPLRPAPPGLCVGILI